MTTAEFRAKRDEADERDLRAADMVVAAGAIVLTLAWAALLVKVLL